MPLALPSSFSLVSSAAGESGAPSTAVGSPCSKSTEMIVA
jgi:hypothetical protein